MSKKMYWVLGALILLVAAFSYVIYQQYQDIEQIEEEGKAYRQKIERMEKQQAAQKDAQKPSQDNPPPTEPGFKWVWHNDHWDKVPIGQPNAHVHHPVVVKPPLPPKAEPKPKPKKALYTGPLTFHAELLKTNPVKALRLQQEERGHWSAAWIPPFPPDDTEAQEFARAVYLWRYYIQTYGYEKLDTPEYEMETKEYLKARDIYSQMLDTIDSYPYGARKSDLMNLTWPALRDASAVSDSRGNIESYPSEYFGDPKRRAYLKQNGDWKY